MQSSWEASHCGNPGELHRCSLVGLSTPTHLPVGLLRLELYCTVATVVLSAVNLSERDTVGT